jgi:asparagine synthase (glutamine-hydrolysing)
MCGIAGFHLLGRNSSRRELEAMSEPIIHRGPDDHGFFYETIRPPARNGSQDITVGLAHRRLSIIDLSPNGAQPMYNEDRSVVLAFNGEIYNYMLLRRRLEEAGHKFTSRTDSEVLVHGYEEWGTDLFSRLNGMFALAIWDRNRREMILARDRLGIKPLYYYHRDGVFLFGSELGAIRKHPLFRARIDPRHLGLFLTFSYVPGPGSIFADTHRLMPGEYLVMDGKNFEKHRYWDLLSIIEQGPIDIGFDEAVKRCRDLLMDSVHIRLMSDVPLGAFLSGGYDSSLVVAMMKEAGAEKIDTFTIGFKEKGYDESPYARAVARHLGTNHHELIFTAEEAMQMLSKISGIYDEPYGDFSALPTYLVSGFARRSGLIVALSGDGGDELFRGYIRYVTTAKLLALARVFSPVRGPLSKLFAHIPSDKWRRLGSNLAFDSIKSLYHHRISSWKDGRPELFVKYPETIARGSSSAFGSELEGDMSDAPNLQDYLFADSSFHKTFSSLGDIDPIHSMSLVDIHTYLVDDILTKVDRASMAVSLEVRVPLLDHRIVEFTASLPTHINVKDGRGKHLLRTITTELIPREILDRPKQGFTIPIEPWLKGPMKDSLLKELDAEKIRGEGFLHADRVTDLVQGFLKGRYHCGRLLWSLFMFELWLKNTDLESGGDETYEKHAQGMHVDSKLLPSGRRV